LPLSNARAFDWTRKKLLKSGRASGEELRAMVEFEPLAPPCRHAPAESS
jgi:hypothetical protein